MGCDSIPAAPSPPSLEVVRIPGKRQKEKHLLTCSTSGGRPCPRVTWRIEDHTEVFGHHNGRQEGDGRCTAVSTLRVSTLSQISRVTCVVRHRTLTPGTLTASYSFQASYSVTSAAFPGENTEPDVEAAATKRNNHSKASSSPTPATTDINPIRATIEASSPGNITNAGNTETRTTNTGVTADVTFTSFLEEDSTLVTADSSHTTDHDVTFTSEKDSTLVTEVTADANHTRDHDVQSSRGDSQRTLILVLVSLMLCVLLLIVSLFLVKLRKAHYSWKKENEASDQTLESNKSRSNTEETSSQSKNSATAAGAAAGQERAQVKLTAIQYNNQVSM